MNFEEISGERQLDFVRKFDYIREAGTDGERKAAASIQEELRSFGLESRLEEFPFEAFEIQEANAAAHPRMVWKHPSSMRKTETISAFPTPPERLLW